MAFWWYMLVTTLIVPVIIMLAGRFIWKKHPKKVNWLFGYRTTRSMKNEETWKFANEYCGKLWFRLGFPLLLPSLVIFPLIYKASENVISVVGLIISFAQLIVIVLSIIPVEKALKETFDDEGNYK